LLKTKNKYKSPKWYKDMPPNDYYSMVDRLGASRFKAFLESPLHYLKFADKPDSPALRLGRMIHKAILEYDEFFNEYIVKPEDIGAKNTKAYKAWYEDQDQHKEVISVAEWQQCEAMREAILSSYLSEYFTSKGFAESTILWNHQCKNGYKIKCKGRLDFLIKQKNKCDLIIDYKTCTDASPSSIYFAMKNYKYHYQEAHYVSGYEKACKGRTARILFIFQEKTSPYDVGACMVDNDTFLETKKTYQDEMDNLSDCIVNKKFFGRNSGILQWSNFG